MAINRSGKRGRKTPTVEPGGVGWQAGNTEPRPRQSQLCATFCLA